MEEWIVQLISDYGYIGVFLIIALENVFPPIPSEVILSFAGFMTTQTHLTIWGVVISSTIGSVVGALILYGIGHHFHLDRFEKWIAEWGHILHLKQEHFRRADAWFQKFGTWTVLFCRMIPLVRSLISVPAGMARMNLLLFMMYTMIGTLIWNVVIIFLGAKFGESWHTVVSYFDLITHVIYFGLGILFLGGIIWYLYRDKKA